MKVRRTEKINKKENQKRKEVKEKKEKEGLLHLSFFVVFLLKLERRLSFQLLSFLFTLLIFFIGIKIQVFDVRVIVEFLPYVLPMDWKGETIIDWDQSVISKEWLKIFWRFVERNSHTTSSNSPVKIFLVISFFSIFFPSLPSFTSILHFRERFLLVYFSFLFFLSFSFFFFFFLIYVLGKCFFIKLVAFNTTSRWKTGFLSILGFYIYGKDQKKRKAKKRGKERQWKETGERKGNLKKREDRILVLIRCVRELNILASHMHMIH